MCIHLCIHSKHGWLPSHVHSLVLSHSLINAKHSIHFTLLNQVHNNQRNLQIPVVPGLGLGVALSWTASKSNVPPSPPRKDIIPATDAAVSDTQYDEPKLALHIACDSVQIDTNNTGSTSLRIHASFCP